MHGSSIRAPPWSCPFKLKQVSFFTERDNRCFFPAGNSASSALLLGVETRRAVIAESELLMISTLAELLQPPSAAAKMPSRSVDFFIGTIMVRVVEMMGFASVCYGFGDVTRLPLSSSSRQQESQLEISSPHARPAALLCKSISDSPWV